MKTSMLIALVGVVAVTALAGAVVASGSAVGAFGMHWNDGTSDSSYGGGHMHQWDRQYSYEYAGETGECPMHHDWNYSWDYEYDYAEDRCPFA